MTPLKSFFFTRKSKGEEKSLKRSFEWKSFHLVPFFLTFARRERESERKSSLARIYRNHFIRFSIKCDFSAIQQQKLFFLFSSCLFARSQYKHKFIEIRINSM